ncbi:MAG: NAD(P)H-hydrate dehydratase [Pirellulales bacterium]|nr:NAD(P)H-hydrate dehydratase [Pirellulales bacterium]
MKQPIDVSAKPLTPLPARQPASHKGDFGRVLIIGGSRNYSGAVALAGMAALRSGAGLVTLAVPDSIQATVAGHEPSMMTYRLPEDDAGQIGIGAAKALESACIQATAIAIGPGLGRGPAIRQLVHWLYTTTPQPVVVDADGLNALAEVPEDLFEPAGPRILTPHPGEFARLSHATPPPGTEDSARIHAAVAFAANNPAGRILVVLKGHHTVITDGKQYAVNPTGNPGMATGGSGDVLTGILAAMRCQDLSPLEAARMAVHVHGLAGDLAAAELGEISMIASDLIRFLPAAFRSVHRSF